MMTPTPADRILRMVRNVMARNIMPHWMADPGVISGCLSGTWCMDVRHRPQGVNLIGAILLETQQAPLEDESPVDTAAMALGVSTTWLEGAADGWCMEAMDATATMGVRRGMYLAGYECGVEARHALSHRCPGCGTRTLDWVGFACDACADAARDAEDARVSL